jgi:hypothetical protein
VSRGGVDANLSYAGGPVFGHEARNARRPLVPMGVNTCQFEGSVDELGGWCSYWPTDSGESFVHSSFDTSYNGLTRGYVVSPDEQWLYLYGSGQSMTHGGAHVGTVFNESGVALLALRRDGEQLSIPQWVTLSLRPLWSFGLFTSLVRLQRNLDTLCKALRKCMHRLGLRPGWLYLPREV